MSDQGYSFDNSDIDDQQDQQNNTRNQQTQDKETKNRENKSDIDEDYYNNYDNDFEQQDSIQNQNNQIKINEHVNEKNKNIKNNYQYEDDEEYSENQFQQNLKSQSSKASNNQYSQNNENQNQINLNDIGETNKQNYQNQQSQNTNNTLFKPKTNNLVINDQINELKKQISGQDKQDIQNLQNASEIIEKQNNQKIQQQINDNDNQKNEENSQQKSQINQSIQQFQQDIIPGLEFLDEQAESSDGPDPFEEGKLLVQEKKFQEAEDQNSHLTIFNLGTCYFRLQDYEKSIEFYQSLELTLFADCRLFFNLAICFERLNNTSQAMINYDKALRMNQEFSEGVLNYSNLLMRIGKSTQAKILIESYLKYNPQDERIINNLNIILAERNMEKKVEEQFKKLSGQKINLQTIYNQGVFFFKQNKFQQSSEIFQQIIQKFQEDPNLYSNQNNTQEGNPINLVLLSHINLSLIYEKQAKIDSAIKILENIY
ncbi:hypothetical protein PPERSA_02603 [Pseudocohnilembus persalinus]|uniref:Tetratricopeptide repeat protein n=1 Tax=Pseudocohnilembus persalinus TaxID=266149 RepID=A0A0V0R5H0_PSEPJ|nr:hypothetical protein PPERSA_02603 [Pseudocohnilembus persalinus]|eukprot:KRX09731.1 hypothetical protein PPERSA_02603 [Pseudocohnilembus persalinus]